MIDKPYEIDIYPVTNGQYKGFIEANGYDTEEYWSVEGVKWRDENKVKLPKYWDNVKFNHPEQPVVGISYYEAEAFANWSGKRLPTEKEWEKAARGTDGRVYPWGNEFDKEKCNSEESGIGKTTRVTVYPDGKSPYNCHDMAGNVWEWCSDLYSKDGTRRVIRGGSWADDARSCRASCRDAGPPSSRWRRSGVRLARSL
jgi:formylglycine-generating enzyme required for sulfatase activity